MTDRRLRTERTEEVRRTRPGHHDRRPLGPIVFGVTGLSDPTAATLGSFVGAVLGYLITAAVLRAERRRRDRELLRAAEAVKVEARLPSTIRVQVDDGRIILDGVADDDAERQRAREVMESIRASRA